MYSVWFEDLEKAICEFRTHLPHIKTFTSIEGNAYGDFVIKTDTKTFIVSHKNFIIWKSSGDWRDNEWTPV